MQHIFYLQTPEAAENLEKIEEIVSKLKLEEEKPHTPKVGELCIAQFSSDKNWYRAKCLSAKNDSFAVSYIDFGNKETLDSSKIRIIHEELKKVPILAKEAFLGFVKLHEKKYNVDALEYSKDFAEGNELSARHEYTIGNRIFLTVLDESSKNLNSDLLRNGLVFLETKKDIVENTAFEKQINLLSKDEDDAKRERVYLWEDGDIYGEHDDKEE